MNWILIVILIIVVVIVILKLSEKQESISTDYPYIKQNTLFSPAERSFLGVLEQSVGENTQIFGKVRVADVITPKKGLSKSNWQKAFNKISSKHFDFLICDKNTLSILCAVELNDSSHNLKKQKDRDTFLEGACKSSNVPLVQIVARKTYNTNEIQNTLAEFIPGLMVQKSTSIKEKSKVNENYASHSQKQCPKCSSLMIKKMAKKGKTIGNEFWACTSFPKCKYTENKS